MIDGDCVAMTRVSINIFRILYNESPSVIPSDLLRELLRERCGGLGELKRHTLTQQTSILRKKLSPFEKIEIITHAKIGYSLNIKGENVRQIKTVGLDKTMKYHWHCFVFQVSPVSSFNKIATVNLPLEQKEITEATLIAAKEAAGVLPESACLNVIYLGLMTHRIFTDK